MDTPKLHLHFPIVADNVLHDWIACNGTKSWRLSHELNFATFSAFDITAWNKIN